MKNDNLDHENRPVQYGITPDELRQIQQRRIEAHAARETNDALNLLRAVKLGAALRESQD